MEESKRYAIELVEKMRLSSLKMTKKNAKVCALIAVQYVINANPHSNPLNTEGYSTMEFWHEVKNELIKIK